MLVVVQGLNFIVFEYIGRHCNNGLIFDWTSKIKQLV